MESALRATMKIERQPHNSFQNLNHCKCITWILQNILKHKLAQHVTCVHSANNGWFHWRNGITFSNRAWPPMDRTQYVDSQSPKIGSAPIKTIQLVRSHGLTSVRSHGSQRKSVVCNFKPCRGRTCQCRILRQPVKPIFDKQLEISGCYLHGFTKKKHWTFHTITENMCMQNLTKITKMCKQNMP